MARFGGISAPWIAVYLPSQVSTMTRFGGISAPWIAVYLPSQFQYNSYRLGAVSDLRDSCLPTFTGQYHSYRFGGIFTP